MIHNYFKNHYYSKISTHGQPQVIFSDHINSNPLKWYLAFKHIDLEIMLFENKIFLMLQRASIYLLVTAKEVIR